MRLFNPGYVGGEMNVLSYLFFFSSEHRIQNVLQIFSFMRIIQ